MRSRSYRCSSEVEPHRRNSEVPPDRLCVRCSAEIELWNFCGLLQFLDMKTAAGLWRLSPSSLYSFTECPSSFWVENNFKKAPMLPLLLNTAMDSILKARFDKYRAEGLLPPEAAQLQEEGIKPFNDLALLNDWRSKTSALKVTNAEVGYELVGKIDDVPVEPDG